MLAHRQRQLLALIRDPGLDLSGDPDPYVARVSASPQRVVAGATNRAWRARALAAQAPCTVRLLQQRGRFDAALSAFLAGVAPISAFLERLAHAFLGGLADDRDGVVAAVARFEAAVLALKRGVTVATVIDWPGDPRPLLAALVEGREPPALVPPAMRMRVDGRLPGWIAIVAR